MLNSSVNFTLESRGLVFWKNWYWVWACGVLEEAQPLPGILCEIAHICVVFSTLPNASDHLTRRTVLWWDTHCPWQGKWPATRAQSSVLTQLYRVECSAFFLCELTKNTYWSGLLCSHRSALWAWAEADGAGRKGEYQKGGASLKLTWPFILNILRLLTLWVRFYSTDFRNIRLWSPASPALAKWPQDVIIASCFNFYSCQMTRVSFPTSSWADLKLLKTMY